MEIPHVQKTNGEAGVSVRLKAGGFYFIKCGNLADSGGCEVTIKRTNSVIHRQKRLNLQIIVSNFNHSQNTLIAFPPSHKQ